MNESFHCDHCGAVTVVPEQEDFSGLCDCCGADMFAAPPADRMRELLERFSDWQRLKAQVDQRVQNLTKSDIPADLRDVLIAALSSRRDEMVKCERRLLVEFRAIIDDALDG